ncbi:MAG TPA: phosphatidylglycerophosphatase A [Rhodanobacteraceae bacterium]|jgi:phosphatidylglycerophosphatase A|nr:phosphatidylglycerophosphatase A [Rhodanobacteraceae bacterium]
MTLDAGQRRLVLSHPAGWIASGFGAGLSPFASGTVGSAVSLIPWLALRELYWPWYMLAVAASFAIGVWASGVVIRKLGIEDPGVVVWDEFVGQWIALIPLVVQPRSGIWIALAFVLFRVFDVWKPWPASWADRQVKGGFGAMLDDVFAGAYAAIALAVAVSFF